MIAADTLETLAADVPNGAEGLAAVGSPEVEIDVTVAGPGGHMRHHVWVDASWALFLLQVRQGEHRVIVVPSGHTPAGLARTLRLRPQPVSESRCLLAPDALDRLVSGDVAVLREHGLTWGWAVSARLVAAPPDDPDGVRHVVAVATDSGQCLVRADGDAWLGEPASTSDVWALVSALLVD